ncbi:MAG: stage II sporulation protein D [Oscillospiraceae bacterium]|nr:stage II sporulation protein D [Oscillospiraceae bacterium]
MKRLIIVPLFVILLCCAPFLLFAEEKPAPAVASAPQPEPAADMPFDAQVTLRVLKDGSVQEMTVEDYLVGTLLAEMPADFPAEALRAQAIASRTFALRKAESGKHTGADVCTSYACCQGWTADGTASDIARVTQAVRDTDGLILTYDGTLIDATFFSCTNGRTESALAVWGSDIPYLQSVDSPGEEDAPRYADKVVFSADEFADRITAICPDANLSGSPANWIGSIERTEGGGIGTVFLGGAAIKGTALRSALGVRSTDMDFTVTEDGITVTTHGFGHRVGFSQYGAKAMAEEGSDFQTILAHYYPGTEIKKLLRRTAEQ